MLIYTPRYSVLVLERLFDRDELAEARARRDAARALRTDAIRRNDTRDMFRAELQHREATNAVLKLENGR